MEETIPDTKIPEKTTPEEPPPPPKDDKFDKLDIIGKLLKIVIYGLSEIMILLGVIILIRLNQATRLFQLLNVIVTPSGSYFLSGKRLITLLIINAGVFGFLSADLKSKRLILVDIVIQVTLTNQITEKYNKAEKCFDKLGQTVHNIYETNFGSSEYSKLYPTFLIEHALRCCGKTSYEDYGTMQKLSSFCHFFYLENGSYPGPCLPMAIPCINNTMNSTTEYIQPIVSISWAKVGVTCILLIYYIIVAIVHFIFKMIK